MAQVIISEKRVDPYAKHIVDHKVDYYLYHEDRDKVVMPKDLPGKHFSGYCFSNLIDYCATTKGVNRILYVMEDDEKNTRLSLREKKEFVKLCRKHKLLPSYFKYDWVGEDVSRIVIKLDGVSPSLLYAYLSNFRYIREDPGFVRALVYLVRTKKLNFHAAYVLASKCCLSHGGHSVIDYIRGYMEKLDIYKVPIPINKMIAVYRFFNFPKKYDERVICHVFKTRFHCGGTINQACSIAANWHIKIEQALDYRLEKLVKLEDEDVLGFAKKIGVRDGKD